jgi:hypothetical protein
MKRKYLCAAVALLLAGFPSLLWAQRLQRIECISPAEPRDPGTRCTAAIDREQPERMLVVRVHGARNDTVRFTLQTPTGVVPTDVLTDTAGFAHFRWRGAPGRGGGLIVVESRAGGVLARREIEIAPAPASTARRIALTDARTRYWYEKRQLPEPLEVRLMDFTGRCDANLVVFRAAATGGSATPDTVRASDSAGERGECIARSWWRLGEGIGRQHVRVTLADEPGRGVVATAVARALPRISAGVVAAYDVRSYRIAVDTARVVRVTRRIALTSPDGTSAGDSTVAVDSVVRFTMCATWRRTGSPRPS